MNTPIKQLPRKFVDSGNKKPTVKASKLLPRVTKKKTVRNKLKSIPVMQYGKDSKTGKKYQIGV